MKGIIEGGDLLWGGQRKIGIEDQMNGSSAWVPSLVDSRILRLVQLAADNGAELWDLEYERIETFVSRRIIHVKTVSKEQKHGEESNKA